MCQQAAPRDVSAQAAAAPAAVAPPHAVGTNNAVAGPHLSTTDVGNSTNIRWHDSMVARTDKEMLLGQRGCVLWFTGLSGSGKSTVACTLEHLLHERGHFTSLLDGDNIRHGLNKDLGFSAEDRAENIRRIGEVARLFADAGAITMTSFISPYRADREMVRERCNAGEFLEVFMNIPLEVCEQRDPKGLYKKARAGLIKNFTGIDDPYEAPLEPEIVVDCFDADGQQRSPRDMAEQILEVLDGMGYLRDPRMPTLTAYGALQRKHSDGILDFAQL
ncbi:hypothetical protein CHLNCDRAFT_141154 [Chlorella variabilis]|uniref:Adenylyl-sulfate kinase n=1 Tax=Chlorella variabilis TaxID=554065 RepID=E1ZS29_CHLVA|nr:hypothetical protein CHLNCDRAFT_141154 [Chlorella variabilis]EFN51375.1 hypothetical protein CHLNCDRAFT_141154 [Chlorella variabilis]|eukprot:XP_005843477.1 hypothetical protein CHLNCDRAFT_141154 [Chlorella variabilis]